jgi:hypothetical protein
MASQHQQMKKYIIIINAVYGFCSIALGNISINYGATDQGTEVDVLCSNGRISKEYRTIGEARFAVRVCEIEPFEDGPGNIVMYSVGIAGNFLSERPKYPYLLVNLNGVWYLSDLNPHVNPVPNTPDRAKGYSHIMLNPGDYCFVLQVKTEKEAKELKLHFDKMKV